MVRDLYIRAAWLPGEKFSSTKRGVKSDKSMKTQYSILELAMVGSEISIEDTLKNALDLARRAEKLGYKRFWLAEHHNMISIASSATSVLIAHVAAHTSTIRLGRRWRSMRCSTTPSPWA